MVLYRPLVFILVAVLNQSLSGLLAKRLSTRKYSCSRLVSSRLATQYMGILPVNDEGGDILMAVGITRKCKKSGLSAIFRLY